MLDRFQVSGGVHCFTVTKPLPKRLIEACLKAAAENASGNATKVIREQHHLKKGVQYLSCTLFRTEKLPPFLLNGTERDIRYCYALIAEIDNHLLISKSGAKDFTDLLEGYAKKVDSQVLLSAFLSKDSDVEKFTAQAIDTVKASIRKQTIEGQRLQDNVSTIGSANKVLNNLQHKTKDKHVSIVGNTGRYNFRGVKGPVGDFIRRNLDATKRFDKPASRSDFLDNFATVLKLSDYSGTIVPSEILINTPDLLDFIVAKANPDPKLYYLRKGAKRYLSISASDYLEKISNLMDLVKKIIKKVSYYYIKNDIDHTLTLQYNTTRYVLHSEKFKHIYLEFDETDSENLQNLINRMQCFNVTFDEPAIHYAAGQLCRDNKLLGNINGFLQMFMPDPLLTSINSEKGVVRTKSKKFPNNTLFNYVESKFKPTVDHLILDDLGYEVGDYIGVRKMQKVQLFLCKAGDRKLSASAFQEVVGQALKNLNFFTQIDAISAKVNLWRKKYASTGIERVRTVDKIHFERDMKATLLATNIDKEIHLVVNFLSLSLLRTQLNNVKAGKSAQKQRYPCYGF